MSDLLVNDDLAIEASAATAHGDRSTDGLENLIDRLSATIQSSEADSVATPERSQSRTLESLFLFGLAGARYAIPMSQVVEVHRMPAWTKLPNVTIWALGAANLRGEIVSVIDLRRFLNLPESGIVTGQLQKLLVLRSLEQDLQIGLAVDRVFGLRHVLGGDIRPPTGDLHESVATYLTGACEIDSQMVLVLDTEHLLKTLAAPFEASS